ncbi:MAG TPA: polyprenyl synthetase family protein, partial [Luteimonas sp.]|nr:polyprenyl synthetase family protein [Luteimonas sp.]
AILTGSSPHIEEALTRYGRHLGTAFQLVDDALDYRADRDALGKNLGDDLAEGKATLPVIHAIAHCAPASRERLREIIAHGDAGALPEVLAAIREHGSLEYSQRCAMDYAQRAEAALEGLPASDWRQALIGLARYAVERQS